MTLQTFLPALVGTLALLPSVFAADATIDGPHCWGMDRNAYVGSAQLTENIKDYCAKAAKISVADVTIDSYEEDGTKKTMPQIYWDQWYQTKNASDPKQNTLETLNIKMWWGASFGAKISEFYVQIDEPTCLQILKSTIADGCDGNNPRNAANMKAGGWAYATYPDKKDNWVGYSVTILHERAPLQSKAPSTKCNLATGDKDRNNFSIKGYAWQSGNFGADLAKELDACDRKDWAFTYKSADNTPKDKVTGPGNTYHRTIDWGNFEWVATGNVATEKKRDCVQNAIEKAKGGKVKCEGGKD